MKMKPQKIRRIRESLKMTQSEFAAELGVSPRCVQRWEADQQLASSRQPRGPALMLLLQLEVRARESAA